MLLSFHLPLCVSFMDCEHSGQRSGVFLDSANNTNGLKATATIDCSNRRHKMRLLPNAFPLTWHRAACASIGAASRPAKCSPDRSCWQYRRCCDRSRHDNFPRSVLICTTRTHTHTLDACTHSLTHFTSAVRMRVHLTSTRWTSWSHSTHTRCIN